MKSDRCIRCNRILTDPRSKARGIGPVCMHKMQGKKVYVQGDLFKDLKLGSPLKHEEERNPGL